MLVALNGDEFGVFFWKLINNIVFGKMTENKRGRRDIELVQTRKRANKVCSTPTYVKHLIINRSLVAIEKRKKTIMLNSAILNGATILELSKVHMYNVFAEL